MRQEGIYSHILYFLALILVQFYKISVFTPRFSEMGLSVFNLLSVSPLVYVAMIVLACIQAGNLLVSKIVRQNLLFLVYARIQADNLLVPKIEFNLSWFILEYKCITYGYPI